MWINYVCDYCGATIEDVYSDDQFVETQPAHNGFGSGLVNLDVDGKTMQVFSLCTHCVETLSQKDDGMLACLHLPNGVFDSMK